MAAAGAEAVLLEDAAVMEAQRAVEWTAAAHAGDSVALEAAAAMRAGRTVPVRECDSRWPG